jgi:hypothetical protein
MEVDELGITIHYTFITWDPLTVANTVRMIAEEAGKAGYGYERVAEDTWAFYAKTIVPIHDVKDFKGTLEYLAERYGGFRAVDRPIDEFPENPPFPYVVLDYPEDDSYMYATPWVSWPRRDYEYGVPTKIEGVIVDPPMVGGKPTAESFAILFYKIGRYYICNGFCKTQPFVMEEVQPNIEYHVWICSVLRRIADSSILWYHVYVHDEAGYYETMNVSTIQESFAASSRFIWAFGSAIQDIVDKIDSNLSVEVAGTHSVKEMKRKLKETYVEDAEEPEEHGYERQTTLDEFGGGEDE